MPRKILLKSINCFCLELFRDYYKQSCLLTKGIYIYNYFFFSLYCLFENSVWFGLSSESKDDSVFPWPARKIPGNFIDQAFGEILPPITRKRLPFHKGHFSHPQNRKYSFFERDQKYGTNPFSSQIFHSPRKVWSKIIQESRKFFLQCSTTLVTITQDVSASFHRRSRARLVTIMGMLFQLVYSVPTREVINIQACSLFWPAFPVDPRNRLNRLLLPAFKEEVMEADFYIIEGW